MVTVRFGRVHISRISKIDRSQNTTQQNYQRRRSMKLREVAKNLHIPPEKLLSYALNPNHPSGKHKARLFQARLSYNQNNAQQLIQQIYAIAPDADITISGQNQQGIRYQADLTISGIAPEQTALVRTVWEVPPTSNTGRLVTIYILNKRVD
jgi:hypothetical protein